VFRKGAKVQSIGQAAAMRFESPVRRRMCDADGLASPTAAAYSRHGLCRIGHTAQLATQSGLIAD
jgi:hypothetical protein